MAGGTGGHVFPALAVANALRSRGAEPFWIGTRKGLEARVVPDHGFEIEWISVEGVRGKGLNTQLRLPIRLFVSCREAYEILSRRTPSVVLGMGGFVSGPGGVMARLLGYPLVVQEQNRVPGMTNRLLSRVAVRVFEGFPGSFPSGRGAICVGNPVRAEILRLSRRSSRTAVARAAVNILVLGGSLGARVLNLVVPQAIAQLQLGESSAGRRPAIIHQAGVQTLDAAVAAYRNAGVEGKVVPFIDDMAEAYAWADLVICRAGALTVSELAAVGIASVLIPYPFAVDDHQVANAKWLCEAGGAQMILERDLTPETLAGVLCPLLDSSGVRGVMAQAAGSQAFFGSADQIADACLEVAA